MSNVLSLHAVVENRYIQLYNLSKNCNWGEWAYSNCSMLGVLQLCLSLPLFTIKWVKLNRHQIKKDWALKKPDTVFVSPLSTCCWLLFVIFSIATSIALQLGAVRQGGTLKWPVPGWFSNFVTVLLKKKKKVLVLVSLEQYLRGGGKSCENVHVTITFTSYCMFT